MGQWQRTPPVGQPVPGLRVLGGDKASVMWGSLWGRGARGGARCARESGVCVQGLRGPPQKAVSPAGPKQLWESLRKRSQGEALSTNHSFSVKSITVYPNAGDVPWGLWMWASANRAFRGLQSVLFKPDILCKRTIAMQSWWTLSTRRVSCLPSQRYSLNRGTCPRWGLMVPISLNPLGGTARWDCGFLPFAGED